MPMPYPQDALFVDTDARPQDERNPLIGTVVRTSESGRYQRTGQEANTAHNTTSLKHAVVLALACLFLLSAAALFGFIVRETRITDSIA